MEIDVVEGQQYTIEVSSYGQDSSGTYELILTPPAEPPQISITSGESIDFGTVTACTTATRSITLANTGFDDLIISQIQIFNMSLAWKEPGVISILSFNMWVNM